MSYLELNSTLPSCWKYILHEYLISNRFKDLDNFVQQAYQNKTCFPPIHEVFRAFQLCSWDNIKVVIIGQDPYPTVHNANGLAFSVRDHQKLPASLSNIYREIEISNDLCYKITNGNLEFWAKQGVLLLNTILTVEENRAGAHQKKGWEDFTHFVLEQINAKKNNVVFMLWGSFAQKRGKNVDVDKHCVLQSGHPSPLSANRGLWFGNNHFNLCNDYLIKHQLTPIEWFKKI